MKYKIPVIWQNWGLVEVEAKNVEEAISLAQEAALPEGQYIDDSFEVDKEGIEFYNRNIKVK